MKNLTIITTDTADESFARAMNISATREAEIDDVLDRCYDLTDTYPQALSAAAQKLRNSNELAYAAFHLGAFAESRRAKLEMINKLLGD